MSLLVAPVVRMAVISTGDEITDDPAELRPGTIMNTNGPMLAGLAAAGGLEVVAERTVGDDLDETVAVLADAMGAAELAVLSGGVSVGDFDFVLAAFERLGLEVHFSRVAVKPGKPTVFASARQGSGQAGDNKAVFGLPGNPVSAYLMFHLFVLRAAARLGGVEPRLRELRLPLAGDYRRRQSDRLQFVPARLAEDGAVETVTFHGSAHLLALGQTDGFFRVPIGVAEVPAGQRVRFVPIAEGGI